jgi:dephospho-CoA kinase
MIKVGITGGIGSGKTHICGMFKDLGVAVYNADERAKYLMQHHEEVKSKILACFGDEAYINGELNRSFLAQEVFANKELLKKLNEIVHPAVAEDAKAWQQEHKDEVYTIKEAALLFETGSYQELDKTILVHADEDERILRVMKRDNVSKDKVLARIQNQMTDIDKMQMADFIIKNDSTTEIHKIVQKIHTYFNLSYF